MKVRGTFLSLLLVALAAGAGEPGPNSIPAPGPLPAQTDLRSLFTQWHLPPRNQGSRPTCSVCTFAGALEFAVAHERGTGERLSAEYLNWAANQTGRGARDGGFFSEMWNGFSRYGICAETNMPYQKQFDAERAPDAVVRAAAKEKLASGLEIHWIKKWNINTGLSAAEFTGIKQTLAAGWPVCGGFRWPKHEAWKDGVLQMCNPDQVFDGHSVLLIGYRDDAAQPGGGVFLIRNPARGGRDDYLPYDYARAYLNDAVWIRDKFAAKRRRQPAKPVSAAESSAAK